MWVTEEGGLEKPHSSILWGTIFCCQTYSRKFPESTSSAVGNPVHLELKEQRAPDLSHLPSYFSCLREGLGFPLEAEQ